MLKYFISMLSLVVINNFMEQTSCSSLIKKRNLNSEIHNTNLLVKFCSYMNKQTFELNFE